MPAASGRLRCGKFPPSCRFFLPRLTTGTWDWSVPIYSSGDPVKALNEKRLTPGWETETYRKLVGSLKRYIVISRLNLRLHAPKNETASLSELFIGESRQELCTAKALLEEPMNFNRVEVIKSADHGAEIYIDSRNWIIGAVLVAAIAGVGAALLILTAVVRPIHSLTGTTWAHLRTGR